LEATQTKLARRRGQKKREKNDVIILSFFDAFV
jgi:hypothetical protein